MKCKWIRKGSRRSFQNGRYRVLGVLAAVSFFSVQLMPQAVFAETANDAVEFERATKELAVGQYAKAAAMFFNLYSSGGSYSALAGARVTVALSRAKLQNAASYFLIKTLQTQNRAAIREALTVLPHVLDAVGTDLLSKYLLRHTQDSDYDSASKNLFYTFLGRSALLRGENKEAMAAFSKVNGGSHYAEVQYLRGVVFAQLGQTDSALASFKACRQNASQGGFRGRRQVGENSDLEARCTASIARTYYQTGRFEQAEDIYDEIPKASFVWTDILFEQAWNSYAKGDYNRALGKLVTYRSPSLKFVFNPEVDVLRAQSFLAMCVYDDVNFVVNEFNQKYSNVGAQMKALLLENDMNLETLYDRAKRAYQSKLHTDSMLDRAFNRFSRGPYFAAAVRQEKSVEKELQAIRSMSRSLPKFSEFLSQVISWRARSVRLLGGLFVKNSLYDLYQDVLANFDKMSFIKLEMLKHTKSALEKKQVLSEDEDGVLKRGSSSFNRRDYQYYWSFNGEFWIDELGDYVFALESQCGV